MEYGDLRFKVVKVEAAGQEIVAAVGHLIMAAFDVAVSVRPLAWIELRQGARVIEKNGGPNGH